MYICVTLQCHVGLVGDAGKSLSNNDVRVPDILTTHQSTSVSHNYLYSPLDVGGITDIYGGPNPPLYKTFAPRFYKTFAPRFYNLLHDFTIF